MIGYAQYTKVKDNYCICYFGNADEYLVQLKLLKNQMQKAFQGLNISFGCKDDKIHFLEDCNVLKITQLKEKRQDFGLIKEIRSDGVSHPVEELLLSSGIDNFFVTDKVESETKKCVLMTKGVIPTENLSNQQIQNLELMAKDEGYHVSINDPSISGAGWVIGVESWQLFEAAGRGIRTTLVPTGVGTRLYKNMFPNGVVLHR